MINKVILVGNLGQEPEKRHTSSGTAVVTLSLATSRRWKNQAGEAQNETEWHRVIVWGKTAEFCAQYLAKGFKVYVEGRLQTRKWQDQNGVERYTTEVIADTVQNLTPKPGSDGNNRAAGGGQPAFESQLSGQDFGDVPF